MSKKINKPQTGTKAKTIKPVSPKKAKAMSLTRNIVTAQTAMKVNGLGVEFNNPPAVPTRRDAEGNEVPQGLPPYKRVVAYAVDEFPACPDNWMHGSAKASSYFLPVQEGSGAWLDFNNCNSDEYDVAVVVSVQGINSVTGQKTTAMRLEQYKEKCPVHDVEFQQDRFCPTCKYKWPAQNYLATTGTPRGQLWLDGFRSADGVIRQYIITADEAKGVAAKKIGKDRVFAVGIAFYRSKDKRPKPVYESHSRGLGVTKCCSMGGDFALEKQSAGGGGGAPESDVYYSANIGGSVSLSFDDSDGPIGSHEVVTEKQMWMAPKPASADLSCSVPQKKESEVKTSGSILGSQKLCRLRSTPGGQNVNSIKSGIVLPDSEIPTAPAGPVDKVSAKTFEVGAGARISQEVHPDPKDLSYWEEEPAGMVYINYTDQESVMKILAAGKREEEDEGFLNDVPVGTEKSE